MKHSNPITLSLALLLTPLAAAAQQFGDFTYSSDGTNVTITSYFGRDQVVAIPATIAGLPVTRIGDWAVSSINPWNLAVTDVSIPNGVVSIGEWAFGGCQSLSQVVLPASLISIGPNAFGRCAALPTITIPRSLTSLGDGCFAGCPNLKSIFFQGNAPNEAPSLFTYDESATVYYLPGTSGWTTTFAGRPTRLWNPLIQTGHSGFGVGPGGFGFNITGTTDIPIVVEACTNLADATWVSLQSINLTNGLFSFSDPEWTNHPVRTYRIRSP